jgi:orotidine-5'-phosphate decarboxylase
MACKIFCAVDTPDIEKAKNLVRDLVPVIGGVKLGLEFFNTHGPEGIEKVLAGVPEAKLFLDLKYHDIPNTVAGAVRSVSERFKPAYLNVHVAGGPEMLRAARDSCAPGTRILGVTVLTSIDEKTLDQIGQGYSAEDQVRRLAGLAREAGLDGVVCSAREIEIVRSECGDDFILMVPGIRPAGSDRADQKRIMTPAQAIAKGATHLVIGRPLTKAPDPVQAAKEILTEIYKVK